MAISNTSILIKRSSTAARPLALKSGELAYSYKSNTLFFGTEDGLSTVNIGGQFYTSTIDSATDANTGGTLVRRDSQGNASFNVIYGHLGTDSGVSAGSYGDTTHIPVIDVAANGLITSISTSTISTTLDFSDNSGGNGSVNLLNDQLDLVGEKGVTVHSTGNNITFGTDDTVIRSNTTSVGPQVIETDLSITGNLTVFGNTSTINVTEYTVDDPIIYLAANNYSSDLVDIGFAANYFDGADQRHTGFFRDATSKDYYLFDNLTQELHGNNAIDIHDSSFHIATLRANVLASSVEVTSQLKVDSGNAIVLNNGNNGESVSIYNGAPDGSAGLFVDTLQYNETNNVVFYNAETKEITYGTMADLRPDAISNGSYAMTISGTDGLVTAPGKILASQSSGTTNGGFSFTQEIGLDTGMFSPSDGILSLYSNDVELFRVNRDSNGVYAYADFYLQNGSVVTDNYGPGALAIGSNAGGGAQSYDAIAIGTYAGQTNQLWSTVAIGNNAGQTGQGASAVAIGRSAGQSYQDWDAIAVGRYAGNYQQGRYAVALGYFAGNSNQGTNSIALGNFAGHNNLQNDAIALGSYAQRWGNGWATVAIGRYSGEFSQNDEAIAIGNNAGNDSQGYQSIALGSYAGAYNQGQHAIAIGDAAGEYYQGYGAIALGSGAGYEQGDYSVSIGYESGARDGFSSLGQYQVAIGYRASYENGFDNSIVINASGSDLSPIASGLYINPVRYAEAQDGDYDGLVFYHSQTKEVRYSYALDGGAF